MEAELESKEPIEMGDDISASEDEGIRGAVVTSVEHREPTAASVGGGRDVVTRGDVPELRKHAVSEEAALKREAKWAQSPHPSEASSATCLPALSVAEHAGWSGDVIVPLHLRG